MFLFSRFDIGKLQAYVLLIGENVQSDYCVVQSVTSIV